MPIHKDHRQRVKSRFLKEGLENFDDVHALELLLFYCVPRRDTNILAHELLERFGTLFDVMNATPEQLRQIEGMGDGAITFIRFLREFERVCHQRKNQDQKFINSYRDIVRCLKDRFMNQSNELVYMICLDAKRRILCVEKVNEGSVNSAGVPTRKMIQLALSHNAAAVVLAHNHPGGSAVASQEDLSVTRYVRDALQAVDVELVDHVIFAEEQYYSVVRQDILNFLDDAREENTL